VKEVVGGVRRREESMWDEVRDGKQDRVRSGEVVPIDKASLGGRSSITAGNPENVIEPVLKLRHQTRIKFLCPFVFSPRSKTRFIFHFSFLFSTTLQKITLMFHTYHRAVSLSSF